MPEVFRELLMNRLTNCLVVVHLVRTRDATQLPLHPISYRAIDENMDITITLSQEFIVWYWKTLGEN